MVFIYGLAFMVLWEWLRPLPIITDTGNLYVFVYFTLFCFVVFYLRIFSYISIPTIFIAMMYGLHTVFFDGSFLKEAIDMLIWFGGDLALNVNYLWDLKVEYLSYEFRSFLLFLVLAIMSYLIHFWIFHVKKIFFFLLITIIYITVIDTFTAYDASGAIIRLVVASFFLMAILYKLRLEEKEQFQHDEFRGRGWTNILIMVIAMVVFIAFALPKYEPHWPDPLPVVKGIFTGENGIGVGSSKRTIGYGQNDEQLGGGFAQDNSIVFTAITKQEHYWRGESKEVYTGKGWQSIKHEVNKTFRYSDVYDAKVALQLYDQSVSKEKAEVTISMVDNYRFWHFFYPGELTGIKEIKFDSAEDDQSYSFLIDYVSGKIGTTTTEDEEPLYLKEYKLNYQYPKFFIDSLRANTKEDPSHIEEVYLQLPELPERVGQLALEITEEYDNRFDKAKAIEGYFAKNDFTYETIDVAIPGPDQDYVDQFLFETKKGYCDNFSTSMIVLLRSIDIPARWVKGFTQGEVVDRLEGGYKEYEISNGNAHSWVEVFFPDVGWVPFEPTKGFSHSFDFEEQSVEEDPILSDASDDKEATPERQQDPENPFLPLEDEMNPTEVGSRSQEDVDSNLNSFNFSAKFIWLLIFITLISVFVYKNRIRLLTTFFLYVYKLKQGDTVFFMKAYQRLLWILALNGYAKNDDETLREYAKRIDSWFNTNEMNELTHQYEKLYYGNCKQGKSWQEVKKSWEFLVKKILS